MSEDHQIAALHRIDTHEKVCSERYGHIYAQLLQLQTSMTAVSNRMFTAALGIIGGSILAVGTLALYLLTKGGH